MRKHILAGALMMAAIGLTINPIQGRAASLAIDTVAEGVFVDDLDLSGMTSAEAVQAVDDYINSKVGSTITLNVDSHQVQVPAGDMGLSCGNSSVVGEAFNYGKKGNIVERYKTMKDLLVEPKVFDLEFSVNEDKIRDIVVNQCKVFDVEAQDAKLEKGADGMTVIPGVTGIVLDTDASIEALTTFMKDEWDGTDASVDMVCELDQPRGRTEDFELVKDVLGTFTTSYSSSGANRSKNVSNGVSKINGTVLYPGDELSVYALCHPFEEENGYAVATAYENGMEVDSVGGGICQVSTTLYNAVLRAELDVTMRYNHSMIVGYVKPSMDAAISGTAKDFRFKNNTDAPIYIEGVTSNKQATFTIYGHETRDMENRKVTYESEVIEQTTAEPAVRYIGDGSKPIGYKAITQKAHTGYQAQLWKIVTENGVEKSREVINKSKYNAAPAYCTVGTMWADPSASAAVNAAIATQDDATISATIAPYAAQLAGQ